MIAAVVIASGMYFGNMLFGEYSLRTLLSLEITKKELSYKISQLKELNSKALKDYFELKGLYPDEK